MQHYHMQGSQGDEQCDGSQAMISHS